ncbi:MULTISPECIES: RNA-binding cell elongation regulator Jag/EloR [unclassified Parvimonas]|uniref:RNA-binding cell elongation regulator Jag/EloR n=1 Tax=unclassified Parvimonas TaxID=1151464 RepID=UPI002B481EF9|nr:MULTISPECIES: RNA-binding cell elongation regulator Jag/EloR [unclassified Parvimonas]MEB3025362.1 RNA-binding cell elongation regulator Jag/EloR [Parvimonas sp. M13]MEB3089498.1 RNA-binding cell elongation regulator Jag/EloR [Parvimonas sp. M20]
MKVVKSAKTVDEAVKLALSELSAEISDVDVKVIEKPKSGFLGFGSKDALVEVSLKEEKEKSKEHVEEVIDEVVEETCCKEEVLVKSDDVKKIEGFLKDLILEMGVDCEVTSDEDEEAVNLYINKSDDFKTLIGKSGETLESIQYIVSIFSRRNTSLEKRIFLDINGYKKRKEEIIREMAMTFAKKAIKYKKVMRLRPMNAYERRIVHSTLYNMRGVFTMSEGEEPHRKVVIKPRF